jgi:hypothetical protein
VKPYIQGNTATQITPQASHDGEDRSGIVTAPPPGYQAFEEGKKLFRANRVAEAAIGLRGAALLHPAAERELWAMWAEVQSVPAGLDEHAEALRELAERALQRNAERAFATFVLRRLERRRAAASALEKLRSIPPRGEVNAAGLRRLQHVPSSAGNVIADAITRTLGSNLRAAEVARISLMAPPTPSYLELVVEEPEGREESLASAVLAELELELERNDPFEGLAVRPDPAAPRTLAPRAPAVPSLEPPPPPAEAPPPPAEAPPPPTLEPLPPPAALPTRLEVAPRGRAEASKDQVRAGLPSRSGGVIAGAFLVVAVVSLGAIGLRAPARPNVLRHLMTSSGGDPARPDASASPLPQRTERQVAEAAPLGAREITIPPVQIVSAAPQPVSPPPLAAVGDLTRGMLSFPPPADGHRVYVDGKMVGTPPQPIRVRCGSRAVQVGSQGAEQTVDVPCGGSAPVAYP